LAETHILLQDGTILATLVSEFEPTVWLFFKEQTYRQIDRPNYRNPWCFSLAMWVTEQGKVDGDQQAKQV